MTNYATNLIKIQQKFSPPAAGQADRAGNFDLLGDRRGGAFGGEGVDADDRAGALVGEIR